jgi:hypothetical protein
MRTLNSKNTENKYILLFFDWIEKEYKIIGKFASLKAIAVYLDMNYNIITQIHKGKSICYKKFLKIERLH